MSLPPTMRALLINEDGYADIPSGSALEAMEPYVTPAEVPLPVAGDGEVLVKVSIAAINPSDVMFIKGMYGHARQKGRAAGFEGVGTVVSSGGGGLADRLVGKRVSFVSSAAGWGTWADYSLASAGNCIPLIDGVKDVDGAAMIVNPLTALAMFGIVRQEGEKSFILTAAASQLCKLIMNVAREEGFRPIAIVRRDDQIPLLMEEGAAVVLNATAPDFAKRLAETCRAEKPRIFLDAVTGPLGGAIFAAMPRRARWIIYGRLDNAMTPIPEPGQLIFMGKKVEGFWLTDWKRTTDESRRAADEREAQQRFADGRWSTDVTAIVPLSEAMKRVPAELAKPNGKVFLAP